MRHLDNAIRRACGGSMEEFVHVRTIMANAIVANLLPDGVVKGGSAIKMRFGDAETRFTTDLDTATATNPEVYAEQLNATLREGWQGFSGRVVKREPARPTNVPAKYVMQPYDVKLTYMGKAWCTVPLEVGHNEIGDAEVPDWAELTDVTVLFKSLGFPALGNVPLMPLEHQIAQKLHAVTSEGDRARDLIDLQLIFARAQVDLRKVRQTCERLFSYRKAQGWPATILKQENWGTLYTEQATGLPVLQSVDEAIDWANELIGKIANS
jgi:predicted nucleotidyltransferase component of viral defense system